MARRIRMLRHDKDVQTLKKGALNKLVFNNKDHQVLYRLYHKAPIYEVFFDGLYDATAEELELIAYIEKNRNDIIHAGDCTFNISLVDQTDWSEIFVTTAPGVQQPDGTYLASITEATLTTELDGEPIFAVETLINRFDRQLRLKRYIHNIGIFDTVDRIRRRINNQEALSKDSRNSVIFRIS